MQRLVTAVALGGLALGLGACGSSAKSAPPVTTQAPAAAAGSVTPSTRSASGPTITIRSGPNGFAFATLPVNAGAKVTVKNLTTRPAHRHGRHDRRGIRPSPGRSGEDGDVHRALDTRLVRFPLQHPHLHDGNADRHVIGYRSVGGIVLVLALAGCGGSSGGSSAASPSPASADRVPVLEVAGSSRRRRRG